MSMRTKTLLAAIIRIVEGELKHLGMRKTKSAHVCVLGEDVFGWVGLNVAANRGDGRVGINLVVGIRHERIEKMVAKLTAEKEPGMMPTISTSLGYVSPDGRYLEWLFEAAPFDYESECKRMVKAIETYGTPFMKSNTTLAAIIDDLEQLRFTTKDAAVYKLPVAYLLSGKADAAVASAKRELKKVEHRSDVVARQYKTFVANLLQEATAVGK
jgi:hypothetical protein